MIPRPDYRRYHFAGRAEHVLAFGAGAERQILIVPPLFDEMNRVRRMLVQAMRQLASCGIGSMLMDLPGCNESGADLWRQDVASWAQSVGVAASQLGATHIASLRGGALVDHGAPALPHWRLAPAKGSSLIKTMIRARIAGDREAGRGTTEAGLIAAAKQGPIELAGYRLGQNMVATLCDALPEMLPRVTVHTLGHDVEGSPLWLRAEPQDDAVMSASIAADLARWSLS